MNFRKITIAQHERGLYLKNRNVTKVLAPGVYRFWTGDVETVDGRQVFYKSDVIDALVDYNPALAEKHFQVIELGDTEIGLVYRGKRLQRVLANSGRYVCFKNAPDLRIDIIDTRENYRVDATIAPIVATDNTQFLRQQAVVTTVEAKSVGLLWIDGEMVDTLGPGLHAFWKRNRDIRIEHYDLRLQMLDVSRQEILTKDKVSLRINLSASYRIEDPVQARLKLQDIEAYLYKALQFELRQAVGQRSLDALLAEKETLSGELFRALVKPLIEFGIKIDSVGVKDIILPGEMRDILNQVVATEKAAQANIIRRREETAATRSLLNTAKLMNDNPTLLRLKELETLEKVIEKVDKLTIYDGLNGLLNDKIKLQLNS